MRMSWQPERERLVCRWSGVGERVRYNPHWMQEVSAPHEVAAPSFLDFTRLSPFGEGDGSTRIGDMGPRGSHSANLINSTPSSTTSPAE